MLIAIQQRGAALGAGFGGGGEVYSTKRGAQKKIYYATIAVATIFLVLGVLNILLPINLHKSIEQSFLSFLSGNNFLKY